MASSRSRRPPRAPRSTKRFSGRCCGSRVSASPSSLDVSARRSGSADTMPRAFAGSRLVIASHNSGKVEEIGTLLAPFAIIFVSVASLGIPEPEETGDSFEANAALKARAAAAATGLPALADDSGLVVPALGGRPGIYSARWAGGAKDFRIAMERVHRELGGRDRSALFVDVLALAWPDTRAERFRG